MTQEPSNALERELAQAESRRRASGLWREPELPSATSGVDFASNDYLGLAHDPEVARAMADAAHELGSGGRAARLLYGGSTAHEACEKAVAAWLGSEAALLFPSGYQANVGLLGALSERGDVLLSDRDNHASIIDGARLSRAQVAIYEHCDLGSLEARLRASRAARRRWVVTESVFSMRGDLAPLAELDALCKEHDAWLVLDEAHAIGILGRDGAGAWTELSTNASTRLCARVVTCGKALGVAGALVACSTRMRAHLINFARSFLFTTAPPPAIAAGVAAAVLRCRESAAARARTRRLAVRIARGLDLPEPAAAIVPIPVGRAEDAVALSERLERAGLTVPAVRPPTVAPGASMLRAVCRATQRDDDVERLITSVRDARAASDQTRGTPPKESPQRTRSEQGGPRPMVVTGTDTEVGKTVVSAILARALHNQGADFAYWKPCQTGDDDDTKTVVELAKLPGHRHLPNHASFPLPASPHEAAAKAGATIDPGALHDSFERHLADAPQRRLLLEFAGGLHVPYRLEPTPFTQADWLARLDADTVLVARAGLGTLNHTLLSVEAMRARRIRIVALFLVGDEHKSNEATLRALAGVPRIYTVPRFASLDTHALDSWLQATPLDEITT